MKFHIITIFPEAFESFLETSVIGKAREKGLFDIELYKLNDFAKEKSGHVDDKAFGMHGQVLSPEPLSKALEHIFATIGEKVPVIYMSPSGRLLKQEVCESLANSNNEYVIICGHYEGIDQRIIDIYVDHEISIGEYVLTGGEFAAQILMDSVLRLCPGVLGNTLSHEEESFSEKLGRQKEYPVYTRPREFMGHTVPEVLTSGDHKKIDLWKQNNLR